MLLGLGVVSLGRFQAIESAEHLVGLGRGLP
jgi:hypothetical protein